MADFIVQNQEPIDVLAGSGGIPVDEDHGDFFRNRDDTYFIRVTDTPHFMRDRYATG
jgi:hypothetical protein